MTPLCVAFSPTCYATQAFRSTATSADAHASSAAVAATATATSAAATASSAHVGVCHSHRYTLLAVGTQSGHVQLWRCNMPNDYSLHSGSSAAAATAATESSYQYVGSYKTHSGYVTALSWCVVPGGGARGNSGLESGVEAFYIPRQAVADDHLLLATGAFWCCAALPIGTCSPASMSVMDMSALPARCA